MKYYAGLDVAMKETFICILDQEGKKVYEKSVVTDPVYIHQALTESKFELEKIGLETGSLSSFLIRELKAKGWNAVCIDARKMAAILSVTINKTDKNDARGIADALRCNHYKETHVKSSKDESIGILLNSRSLLVNARRTFKNTIRGHLKSYGIRLGAVSDKNFFSQVRSYFAEILPTAQKGLESLLKSYEQATKEIKKLEKELRKLCKEDKEIQRLMTVPGVGMIVALSFKSSIGDPKRFKESEAVGAYFGMTPRQYSSGETTRLGHISRCGSKEMRCLLTEAAIVLLTRSQSWSRLKAWGLKILHKQGFKKATMAVGRKLAVILHRMLITGESFQYGSSKA